MLSDCSMVYQQWLYCPATHLSLTPTAWHVPLTLTLALQSSSEHCLPPLCSPSLMNCALLPRDLTCPTNHEDTQQQ